MNYQEAKKHLEDARQAGQADREDTSVQLYAEIIKAIPIDTPDPALKQIRLDALQERGAMLVQCNLPSAALIDFQTWQSEATVSSKSVDVFIGIAQAHVRLGEYDKAAEAYQQALNVLEKYPDIKQQALVYSGLANAYAPTGRILEAIEYDLEALKIYQLLNDQEAEARVLNGLGINYKRWGEQDKAIASFNRSIALGLAVGALGMAAIATSNLGESYQDLFDMETALHHHQEALVLLKKSGEDRWRHGLMSDIHRNIGIELLSLGQVDEGVHYLNRARQISATIKMVDVELQVLNSCALSELTRGHLYAAKETAQESVKKAREANAQSELSIALYVLGLCQQAEGDISEAEKTWQEASALADALKQRNVFWRIQAALAQIVTPDDKARAHQDLAVHTLQGLAKDIGDDSLRQKFLNAPEVQAVLAQS